MQTETSIVLALIDGLSEKWAVKILLDDPRFVEASFSFEDYDSVWRAASSWRDFRRRRWAPETNRSLRQTKSSPPLRSSNS